MSSLFLMSTITDRRTADAFLQLYEAHGVNVTLRTVGTGTAVQETLSTLGLEKTEKAVLLAVVTAQTWQEVQRDLRRKMRIDVPGTGIAFTVPLSSIGGKRALGFLTEHQTLTWKEESTLKDGLMIFVACLPIAIAGLLSAIHQGKTSVASIGIVAKKPEQFGKAMLFPAMVETYAILALLISILAVSGIQV